jgi:hypothetical protein
LIAPQDRETTPILAQAPSLPLYLIVVSDEPHEPVVINAQDLMGPGPVLLIRREITIKEYPPFIKADKTRDTSFSVCLILLSIEVGVDNGKGMEDLLQNLVKEQGIHGSSVVH